MDIPELDIEEEQELGGFIQDEHVVVKEQPRSNKEQAEPSNRNRNDIVSVKLRKKCRAKLTTFKRNVPRKHNIFNAGKSLIVKKDSYRQFQVFPNFVARYKIGADERTQHHPMKQRTNANQVVAHQMKSA
ncbi:hypothetical protein MTP99_005891 [Tenebrio molitor]|nr:hypothetical protein MTP99_005891 [Tenebrio molitor]